jgi:hypothetical protein
VTGLGWKIKPIGRNNDAQGAYFLRTNYTQVGEKPPFEIYNTIREVEAAFRGLMTELNQRPGYHKKDEHSMYPSC